MSPVETQPISKDSKTKKKSSFKFDGKLVSFKDFEIQELIGEGSFGRVFRAKHKTNGQVLALKVMKKQYLISNH